jgi:hypothetical protein
VVGDASQLGCIIATIVICEAATGCGDDDGEGDSPDTTIDAINKSRAMQEGYLRPVMMI